MSLGTSLAADLTALFANPSPDPGTLAGQWASAMGAFFAGVAPASISVAAATSALATALEAVFAASPAPGLAGMESAFLAFANAVGVGMTPYVGAIASPPPFTATAALPRLDDHAGQGARWAAAFTTWAHAGIATPPIGPPVLWT